MTIVLQHKFWDLMVFDDRFEVKLAFNGVPERLVIPLAAIKSFVDPSVQFGFNPNLFAPAAADGAEVSEAPMPMSAGPTPVERTALPRPAVQADRALASDPAASEPDIRQEEQPDRAAGKIVELDLFRKK
jgi:uncharacterized protein